ncbi:hypothetical protein LTR10_010603 [Elasticomyces elasticus]|nr:hypothetical protein LTR10_010603 [Elasticomyces elasticus]KAK4968209.1 hypothetical protein LTR42_009492 [Elasticomyces elasticus]
MRLDALQQPCDAHFGWSKERTQVSSGDSSSCTVADISLASPTMYLTRAVAMLGLALSSFKSATAELCEVSQDGQYCSICAPGSVAVGTLTPSGKPNCAPEEQLCLPDSSGPFGVILNDRCNFNSISWDGEDLCGGHWTDPEWTSYCEGPGGAVNEVAHTLGDGTWDFYGNCAPPTGVTQCKYNVLTAQSLTNVAYCCEFIANLKSA